MRFLRERRLLENSHIGFGLDISPMPVRHGQTPAPRLQRPEFVHFWNIVSRLWTSAPKPANFAHFSSKAGH
jgi:hypothetical protein